MKLRKITYRLYPTPKQQNKLLEVLHSHQQLYNAALEQRIRVWRGRKKTLSFIDQIKDLTKLRAEDEKYRNITAQASQKTLKRLDLAFQAFFRRFKKGETQAGFPRFKPLNRFNSFGYSSYNNGWSLISNESNKQGKLRLFEVGLIKLRGSVRTEGEPKTLDVLYRKGKWYASVTIRCEPDRQSGTQQIGMDWGVKTFLTLVDSQDQVETVENPRFLRNKLDRLKKLQRSFSKKTKGSINYLRLKSKISNLYEKITNTRKDFLHKLSASIVSKSSFIATEKLNIKSMVSENKISKSLNREILSTSPALFFQMLRYKAEEAGIEWHEVPTKIVKPTQTCSGCGKQAKKDLSEHLHSCECGLTLDRDVNAAKVMLLWALKAPSGQKLSMCGVDTIVTTMKHEPQPSGV